LVKPTSSAHRFGLKSRIPSAFSDDTKEKPTRKLRTGLHLDLETEPTAQSKLSDSELSTNVSDTNVSDVSLSDSKSDTSLTSKQSLDPSKCSDT